MYISYRLILLNVFYYHINLSLLEIDLLSSESMLPDYPIVLKTFQRTSGAAVNNADRRGQQEDDAVSVRRLIRGYHLSSSRRQGCPQWSMTNTNTKLQVVVPHKGNTYRYSIY